ncbi:hypothetical protein DICPUDRAFT_147510 [Dictyostelium purpureum]|uniref:Rho-GAP domain-containing protein n=1 Tax=Dictyostelium purpureum TaxID=5786 RepID=F0Z8N7_DICPU|nr:uncharacterized protein DICPUDRAFT_147510 [Dictyostelium purpureum]EGC39687.1 hypothetical protein DICPUDRAFT_147510 [Dictyostelium purpureum]|eukprot:XP_003283796.1 hypothetical protein DICPUDRAFT_147510 [Dictyostelium purpureum]
MNNISNKIKDRDSNSSSNIKSPLHQRSSSSTASTGSGIGNTSNNNSNSNNKLNIRANSNNSSSPPGGVSPPMSSINVQFNGGTPTIAQLQSLVKGPKKPINTSFDDLRNQLSGTNIDLSGYGDDDEVIINHDYHSSEEEEYEYDDEEYEDQQNNNSVNNNSVEYNNNNQSISSTHSCESIPEEEELTASPIHSRKYSHTIGSQPDNLNVGGFSPRSNRSESTVYHGEPENEKVSNAKDKISSEYKKMMEDLDGFRNEKLKQRKSKYFSKKELEEIPFNPSSGTKLRSTLYKQFMNEKIIAMNDGDKYRIELLKSYRENLKPADISPPSSIKHTSPNSLTSLQAGNGGIILQKDKLIKLNRTRSVSQPPVVTSNSKSAIGTLEQILDKEKKRDGIERALPVLLIKCIDFLSKEEALKTEGLFRVAGNSSDVEDLTKSILSYGSDIPENCCVHVVSNMLKKFLRQLTTPVFTFKHYNDFIQALKSNSNDQERIESIKKILKLLPINNQILIKELMGFLVKVTEYSNVNMMHSYNLGVMLGPNVLKPPNDVDMDAISNLDSANQVITLIIENYSQIYDIK